MTDKETAVIDVLCGNSKTQWSLCDTSCSGCNFYFEDYDMGAVVPICIHGFGKSRNSCDYYMTHQEYSQLVRSCLANFKAENEKLRELVRHMHECMCNVDADGNYECYSCEYDNADDGCNFERLMRGLGIEVDR